MHRWTANFSFQPYLVNGVGARKGNKCGEKGRGRGNLAGPRRTGEEKRK